jgi:hypothetical protein
MNLKELQNKTLLLFGRSRAFSEDEFNSQLKYHKINLTKEYSDDVCVIVDGKMMTPYEQNESDKLYEQRVDATFVSIDALERELAKHIDADTLMMSLKLSNDRDRLRDFLTNSMIEDELFLRLLKMYKWNGENFFDNDENRDISAAIIVRFYENIERNHNVEYAALGLMHLAKQTKNEKLIETIAYLEPLVKSMKLGTNRDNFKIISAIATNEATQKDVLKVLIKNAPSQIRKLIATREDCDEEMQNDLLLSEDKEVLEALSYNSNLCKTVLEKLLDYEELAKNIARNINLDDDIFKLFLQKYPIDLAKNKEITSQMQEKLASMQEQEVLLSLATNQSIDEKTFMILQKKNDEQITLALYENPATPSQILQDAYLDAKNHFALAKNENTPKDILKRLFESEDAKVLKSLAKNKSTPVEVLYQLQLDSRFDRAVKENPNFGKHIMSENIGWQV